MLEVNFYRGERSRYVAGLYGAYACLTTAGVVTGLRLCCYSAVFIQTGLVEGRKQRGQPTTGDHATGREEREISRLEKLLGMRKRKRLPAYFKNDGLDCILPASAVARASDSSGV